MKKIVKETLKWCNDKRKEKGLKPLKDLPKGEPSNPESCPCGKATGLLVHSRYYRIRYDEPCKNALDPTRKLPVGVQEFIKEFDTGKLPEYDETISTP